MCVYCRAMILVSSIGYMAWHLNQYAIKQGMVYCLLLCAQGVVSAFGGGKAQVHCGFVVFFGVGDISHYLIKGG